MTTFGGRDLDIMVDHVRQQYVISNSFITFRITGVFPFNAFYLEQIYLDRSGICARRRGTDKLKSKSNLDNIFTGRRGSCSRIEYGADYPDA